MLTEEHNYLNNKKLMKLADMVNMASAAWCLFVLVPTWFAQFERFNGVAVSIFAVLASIHVVLLRKHISNSNRDI